MNFISGILLINENPDLDPNGMIEGFLQQVLGWIVYMTGAAAVGVLIWIGIQMIVGRRNRSQMAADGLSGVPWVLCGLILTATAAGITNFVLDSAEREDSTIAEDVDGICSNPETWNLRCAVLIDYYVPKPTTTTTTNPFSTNIGNYTVTQNVAADIVSGDCNMMLTNKTPECEAALKGEAASQSQARYTTTTRNFFSTGIGKYTATQNLFGDCNMMLTNKTPECEQALAALSSTSTTTTASPTQKLKECGFIGAGYKPAWC